MKMRTAGKTVKLAACFLAVLFVFLCLSGAVCALDGDAPEDWSAYSPLGTIVLEDEYKNATEEEIGVLPVGQYKLSVPGVGYVTYGEEDTPLSVSGTDENDLFTLIYQVTGDMPNYTLSPGDALYSVVGTHSSYSVTSNSGTVYNNSRKTYTYKSAESGYYRTTQDSYRTIRWYIEENGDGTVKLALYDMDDPKAPSAWRYYAYYDASAGEIRMKRDTAGLSTDFKLEMVSRGTAQFNQYISYGGRITLRLPKAAKTQANLTDERAAKWANDVEKAYRYFKDLTAFAPFENIIVKAYADCDYMAYVTGGYNTITVSYSPVETDFGPRKTWYIDDISELVQRGEETNDWNFCILHEMGHMFDHGRGWNFETECMTDFKLAYCLYRGGACAVPSEFSASDVFTYANIEKCYKRLGGDFDDTYSYSFYGAACKMMRMQKEIGWAPVYRAFHWYAENAALPASEQTPIPGTRYGKFQLFIDKISEYAGVDVRQTCFSDVDWAVFMNYYGHPDYPEPPKEPLPEDGAMPIGVSALFGHIENYAGKTYFIVGVTADDNEEFFSYLRSGEFVLKATLTDETTGAAYTVGEYHFNRPGDEFYGTSFLRLCFCDYGVRPMPGHEYTLLLDVFYGEERFYTGRSSKGAFCSTNAAFNENGAIMPAKPPYSAEVSCKRHDFGTPAFTWDLHLTSAEAKAVCLNCGEAAVFPCTVGHKPGAMTATANCGGKLYSAEKAYVAGDLSGNGRLAITDVTLMLDTLAALPETNGMNLFVADVDGDGTLTIADVTALLDLLAG
ncbi:MAG: dockerin type I repeat-containing protein [Clostridia bacterium]|nr:dockerin type I repeat-containing protein [Clostridia bacterium]